MPSTGCRRPRRGTIFGRDVDGSRIGVARGVRQALIGKIIGDDGHGNSDAMCDGIRWAVDQRGSGHLHVRRLRFPRHGDHMEALRVLGLERGRGVYPCGVDPAGSMLLA
jgi:hypothetical protein